MPRHSFIHNAARSHFHRVGMRHINEEQKSTMSTDAVIVEGARNSKAVRMVASLAVVGAGLGALHVVGEAIDNSPTVTAGKHRTEVHKVLPEAPIFPEGASQHIDPGADVYTGQSPSVQP